MSLLDPRIVRKNEGKTIRIFAGVEFIVKVSSEDSGGAFTLLDNLNPAGTFLPPHIHHRESETFYIMEGQYEFNVDGTVIHAGPGDTVYAPQGVPHSFKVTSETDGRVMLYVSPGGFDLCAEAMSKLPLDPPDMGAIIQTCMEHGIEFLPPPGP